MFRIYYENVHTYELHESKILKPSFLMCGSRTLTKEDWGKKTLPFTEMLNSSSLIKDFSANICVEHLNLKTNIAGFLTLGKTDKENNIVCWDRKWCVLQENNFFIYNYPQDKALGNPPIANVNLEYCLEKLTFSRNAPKRKSFCLKTGRPSTKEDNNAVNMKHKTNFVLDKYFLAADSTPDFERWTNELDSALEFLSEWDKLVFADDYYTIP